LCNDNGGGKQMPINNISDWLSFLNERITSYETLQNSYATVFSVVLGLVVAMAGIIVTTYKDTNSLILIGEIISIGALPILDIFVFNRWMKEFSANSRYRQALRIRREILEETLAEPNDIYQKCIDARIL
jgi:hypothetical protein